MAIITADIKIPEAALSIRSHLYFPTDLPEATGNKVAGVITLLHGFGNDSDDWFHFTAACRYAADNGCILVAPSAQNAFYLNMQFGPAWGTVMSEWYPRQLQSIFKIPTHRTVNAIAGLSMGGYGAMLLGLSHPEHYAAIGSFSGALDMPLLVAGAQATPECQRVFAPIFGQSPHVPESADLVKLAEKAAQLPAAKRPRLYCSVGRQDESEIHIYTQNQSFRKAVEPLGFDFCYAEWDGVHEWNFWDRSLAEFIGFMQKSSYGAHKQKDWKASIHG